MSFPQVDHYVKLRSARYKVRLWKYQRSTLDNSCFSFQTLPCYLALFALAEYVRLSECQFRYWHDNYSRIFELFMAFDALRMRNNIQLLGLLLSDSVNFTSWSSRNRHMLVFHIALIIAAAGISAVSCWRRQQSRLNIDQQEKTRWAHHRRDHTTTVWDGKRVYFAHREDRSVSLFSWILGWLNNGPRNPQTNMFYRCGPKTCGYWYFEVRHFAPSAASSFQYWILANESLSGILLYPPWDRRDHGVPCSGSWIWHSDATRKTKQHLRYVCGRIHETCSSSLRKSWDHTASCFWSPFFRVSLTALLLASRITYESRLFGVSKQREFVNQLDDRHSFSSGSIRSDNVVKGCQLTHYLPLGREWPVLLELELNENTKLFYHSFRRSCK